jgi:hypothetical protein
LVLRCGGGLVRGFLLVTFTMAAKKVEEPKFVIQITTEFETASYLKKFITVKKIAVTEEVQSAFQGPRNSMIGKACLLRQNGYKAWALPYSSLV